MAQTTWKDLAAFYGGNPGPRRATVAFKQCKDILLTWLIHGIMKSCLSKLELCFHFLCPDGNGVQTSGSTVIFPALCLGLTAFFLLCCWMVLLL